MLFPLHLYVFEIFPNKASVKYNTASPFDWSSDKPGKVELVRGTYTLSQILLVTW